MLKPLKAISMWAFALFVALALAVGAKSALAQPVTMDCLNDGWVHLGSCTSAGECTTNCQAIHGQDAVGHCPGAPNGCCTCLF